MRTRSAFALAVGAALALAGGDLALDPAAIGAPPSANPTPAPGGGSPQCAVAPAPGSRTVQYTVDDRTLNVLVHVPPGLAAGSHVPLLIALHGFRGDGPAMERGTGFSALADRQRFVVAYPSAPGGQWAIYAGEPRAKSDLDFVRTTIDQLSTSLCIDRRRRFVVGVSNGAGEVARVGCLLADRLAGVAPVAGDYRSLPTCHPPRPISIMEIHGVRDPVVPFRGRSVDHSGAVPSFVATWRTLDHCGRSVSRSRAGPHSARLTWHCAGHTMVSQVKLYDAGHVWPGSPAPGHVPGPESAASVIWRFFSGLRQRGQF